MPIENEREEVCYSSSNIDESYRQVLIGDSDISQSTHGMFVKALRRGCFFIANECSALLELE